MEKFSLTALIDEHLANARAATSGRSAHTVVGGHDRNLRQTLVALRAGHRLDDHENPGEATVQVLRGRVRMATTDGNDAAEATGGELLVVPDARHNLEAVEDSVLILTVAKSGEPVT